MKSHGGDKEKQYTARYAEITEKDAVTLWHWRSVADFFNSCRRRQELSHSHHIEAQQGSGGDKAIADHWLGLAVEGKWSHSRLRAEIRRKNRTEMEPDEPMPQVLMPLQLVDCARWASLNLKRVDAMEFTELRRIVMESAPIIKIVEAAQAKLGKITQAA